MFFLYILLVIILASMILKIELKIVKKEDTYVEISILNINIFHKKFKENNRNNLNVLSTFTTKKKRLILKKIIKFFKITKKKLDVKKADINITVSNSNFITGSYIISFFYFLKYAAKNINDKINITCQYLSQKEKVKIEYFIIIKARIISVVIALLKLVIIINVISKKGMRKNGKSSNRKLNDDCNVIY